MAVETIVLITGCSTGIGLSTAVLLAKDRKCKVYATMRNLAKKDLLETAAGDALDKFLFIRSLDVTKSETVTALVDDIIQEDGRIDVLVNNAGVTGIDGITFQSVEWGKAMMDTNFWGVVRMTNAVLPSMKARKAGRIINVGSVNGINGKQFFCIYSASKFALEGYCESIVKTLREGFNIRVSVIEPALVITALVEGITKLSWDEHAKDFDARTKELFLASMNDQSVAPTFNTSEEIAELIKEIMGAENPHLRYQTSEETTKVAKRKWLDSTGDSAES